MSESRHSRYAETLNALSEMQQTLLYAARRPVLEKAEFLIVMLEEKVEELERDLQRSKDNEYR